MREPIQDPVTVKAARAVVSAAKAFLYTKILNEFRGGVVETADLDLASTLHSLRARPAMQGTLPFTSGFMTVAISSITHVISWSCWILMLTTRTEMVSLSRVNMFSSGEFAFGTRVSVLSMTDR